MGRSKDKENGIQCVDTPCVVCGQARASAFAQGKDYEYRTSERTFTFVRCENCGHVYLNPRPADHCIALAYPVNYYTLAGRHTARGSLVIARLKSWVVNRRLRFFRELLKGDARILEVGCGDGSLLADLKKRNPRLTVEGLDITLSGETAERCAALDIPVMETAVENAELGHGRFDLIIMNQVIEHVPDPVAVMKKLAEALKPGGCVSIETPNLDGYDRRLFRKSFWGGYYFPRHLHLFHRESLKGLVEKSGLTVVQQSHLLAPIIWIFSVHAFVSQKSKGKGKREGQSFFFSARNPFCLSLFTLVDLLARLAGFPTSNQKIIARK